MLASSSYHYGIAYRIGINGLKWSHFNNRRRVLEVDKRLQSLLIWLLLFYNQKVEAAKRAGATSLGTDAFKCFPCLL